MRSNQSIDPRHLFPRKDETWAWAHVHINQNVIGDTLLRTSDPAQVPGVEQKLANLLGVNPDNASFATALSAQAEGKHRLSRLRYSCLRNRSTGRIGIGPRRESVVSSLRGKPTHRLFPIYYRWFFRTGTKGDFEFLVDLLEPRPVDKRVGVRDMDMQQPDYETNGMVPPLDVMGLEGALKSPQMESVAAAVAARRHCIWEPSRRFTGTFSQRSRGEG